eukprot:gene20196-22173_t
MAAKYEMGEKDEVELRSPMNDDLKSPTEEEIASCRPCRIVLVIIFTLALVGMLVAAIVVIATTSGCAKKAIDNKQFWKKEMAYEIYVHSFQDTNDDGYGDFKGVKQRLDYLEGIGAKIIVLSGFMSGENFYDLHSKSGSIKEFQDLVAAAKKKQMSIAISIDAAYTTSTSNWFSASKNRNLTASKYKDWYIWRGTGPNLPNNWKDGKGSASAWELDPTYNQYYYKFDVNKPMLDFNNTEVKKEFVKALEYWLKFGVKGFKLNNYRWLVMDSSLRDNTDFPRKYYNKDQPGVHMLLKEWNTLVKRYGGFIMGEAELTKLNTYDYDVAQISSYYGTKEKPELDMVLNDKMTSPLAAPQGTALNKTLSDFIATRPHYSWPAWVVSGPNYQRMATRYNAAPLIPRLVILIQLTYPGSTMFYYGDEIGLKDSLSKSTTVMAWDGTINGGFSKKNPWYSNAAVNPPTNVEAEKKLNGTYKSTAAIMKLRQKEISLQSAYIKVLYANQDTIVYIRSEVGQKGFLIAVNMGSLMHTANVNSPEAKTGKVLIDTLFKLEGRELKLSQINLDPYQGLVIRITE